MRRGFLPVGGKWLLFEGGAGDWAIGLLLPALSPIAAVFDFDFSKIPALLRYAPDAPLLFSSGLFLFLFIGFFAVHQLLLGRSRLRIAWVTLFSLFFYYKCAGHFWLLHVVIVAVDFYLARCIEQSATSRDRAWLSVFMLLTGGCLWLFEDVSVADKVWWTQGLVLTWLMLFVSSLARVGKVFLLVLSLLLNLGMLAYFKYNFDSELWCELSGKPFDPALIFLPAGISFFTFQSLSYTIDVYRGQLKALDNMLDYAFFVTFFPQMLAGPIVRAADFLPQIHKPLWVSREDFGRGVFLIATGLFKKAVVSDYISVNFVDRVFDSPLQYSGLENLMAVYGYAMQIYCYFSGYSDMAIGLALLMGFRFPINFDSPYQSLSITEFWRRWHISLSSWLRDYLYIPLGGNRGGSLGTWLVMVAFFLLSVVLLAVAGQWWWIAVWAAALLLIAVPTMQSREPQSASTGLNLLATMLLGGLWHGAASRFILWGALHGLALAAERWVKMLLPGTPGAIRRALGGLWTFHFVCFCWVFFRAPGMEAAGQMLSQIAFDFRPEIFPDFVTGYAPVVFWLAAGYLLHLLPKSAEQWAERSVTWLPLLGKAALLVAIAVLVMQVKSAEVQPFIYFQF